MDLSYEVLLIMVWRIHANHTNPTKSHLELRLGLGHDPQTRLEDPQFVLLQKGDRVRLLLENLRKFEALGGHGVSHRRGSGRRQHVLPT